MTAIKIVFCDNDSLSRESIKILLKKIPQINIIGEFDNSFELISYMKKPFPDIILYDLQGNSMTDLIQIQKIILKYPDSKIIVISTYEDLRTITTAFKIGVIAFLMKRDITFSDLSNAISYSKENNPYISSCSEYKMENINKLIQLNYSINTLNWM
ncbi:MAG: response regulator [Bacteroidetes bacterium]|nr:response regulator [Bacteroidota bacterium]